MTKSAEIEIIDATILKLGPNSYLGPWLKENRAAIVADISNDFSVSIVTPGEWTRQGIAELEQARIQAREIVEAARTKAEGIIVDAKQEASSVRGVARRQLEELARKI